MDTTDPNISFDENWYCNHCINALKKLDNYPFTLSKEEKEKELLKKISEIKEKWKWKKYDAIIWISWWVDSSYVAVLVKKYWLRVLAIHLDNWWNSELAVKNIQNLVKKLDLEFYTEVLDWNEFKDLQLSFLKASVPDLEIPTDHAIISVLYKVAKKFDIDTLITWHNVLTESIGVSAWSNWHYDWKYIKNIYKKFTGKKLKNFPHMNIFKIFKIFNFKWLKRFEILSYIDFNKKEILEYLKKEFDYKEYSTKHGESIYTHFTQSYVLPRKFWFDKRKAHLSNLIISWQITREDALNEINKNLFTEQEEKELLEYVSSKFEITLYELNELLNLPNKSYYDYNTYDNHWFWWNIKKIYNKLKK